MDPQSDAHSMRPPRSALLLMVLAVAFVVVPLEFWRQTWFGRPLSNGEIEKLLHDQKHPRRIQQALTQISERIERGDPAVKQWYPPVAALARHPVLQIRTTAAWVMGQDNGAETFHQALLEMLKDPDLMVRRNAALSLTRFQDAAGRRVLVEMLQPHVIRAPQAGTVSLRPVEGHYVGAGTLLARITSVGRREVIEVRAPLSGAVSEVRAREAQVVSAGDPLLSLQPEPDQVWEALRGLYLVGEAEDLPAVEPYAAGASGDFPERTRRQAALTARSIRSRIERSPSR